MSYVVAVRPGRLAHHRYALAFPDEDRAVRAGQQHAELLAGNPFPWGDRYAVLETQPRRQWEVVSPYGETLHTVIVLHQARRGGDESRA